MSALDPHAAVTRALQRAGADGLSRLRQSAREDVLRFMVDMIDTSVLSRTLVFTTEAGQSITLHAVDRSLLALDGHTDPLDLEQVAERLQQFAASGHVHVTWTPSETPAQGAGIPAKDIAAILGLPQSLPSDPFERAVVLLGSDVLALSDAAGHWDYQDDCAVAFEVAANGLLTGARRQIAQTRSPLILLPVAQDCYVLVAESSAALLSPQGLRGLSRLWLLP